MPANKPTSTAAKATAAPAQIQIFKPGKHVSMAGQVLAFSEADLAATCAAYDPTLHEAPLVVGHPQHDLPAYGWVKSLAFCDGAIDATPAQVNPDFADMVAAGAFKKISAAFYSPDAPSNPVPGVYYLRHVGFLGAQAPAVKGLRSPEFADTEEGVVTFGEWDDTDNAALWRNMREWILAKFGADEADRAVPGYTVKNLEQGAQDELRKAQAPDAHQTGALGGMPAPAFGEQVTNPTTTKEMSMTPEEIAAQTAALNAAQAETAALREQMAAQKRAAVHAQNVAFCEGLTAKATLAPAHSAAVVAVLDHLDLQDTPVEFGEGEARAPLAKGLRDLLQALPPVVSFGEHATTGAAAAAAGGVGGGTVAFAAPDDYTVDPMAAARHSKALAYQAQHKCDYLTAARATA